MTQHGIDFFLGCMFGSFVTPWLVAHLRLWLSQ